MNLISFNIDDKLLDKESYKVTICGHKAVWRSVDSETMLTIATCTIN